MSKIILGVVLGNTNEHHELLANKLLKIQATLNNKVIDTFVISIDEMLDLDYSNANISEEKMYQRIKKHCKNRNLQLS